MNLRSLLVPVAILAGGLTAPVTAAPNLTYATVDYTVSMPNFGAGTQEGGTLAGVVNGYIDGVRYRDAALNATVTYTGPTDAIGCQLTNTAIGTYTLGDLSGLFDWNLAGRAMGTWTKLPDGTWVHTHGVVTASTPEVPVCGQPLTLHVKAIAIDDFATYGS